jgi:hypothetical protein
MTAAACLGLVGPNYGDAGKASRLKAMRAVTREAALKAGGEGARVPVERVEDPLYRFDDPTRGSDDATIGAWGRHGRPAALLTLSVLKPAAGANRCLCEWTGTDAAGVVLARRAGAAITPRTRAR